MKSSAANSFDVALIVPAHERADELCVLLDSLALLNNSARLEVIVVDDGSARPLEPLIRSKNYPLNITFLRNEQALGPSAARNCAAAATQATYLWFLDSDTEILSPDTLSALAGRLAVSPKTGAVGGVMEPFGAVWKPVRLLIWPNFLFVYVSVLSAAEAAGRVDGLGTCNLMLRRKDFETAGGFDEALRRDEDVDLCLRLVSRRLRIEQVAAGLVRHHLSSSGRDTGQLAHFSSPRDYFHDMLGTRARLLARHRPMRAAVLPLLDAIFLPLMALQVLRKRYSTNRMAKMASSSRIQWLGALVSQMLQSYATAWRELCKRGRKAHA